jgi:uncharacterized protein YyaL (SSP411 family)
MPRLGAATLLLLFASVNPCAAAAAPVRSAKPSVAGPYLQLHANDAVRWMPWGDEAFARALKEDKPVFLSIGYASCRWCHVMQRESFVDAGIGEILNTKFVPVLVDREEHPDIDAVYLSFLQESGWPANVVLTPERMPVAAATYMKRDALREMLTGIAERWTRDRPAVLQMGAALLAGARDLVGQPRESGSPESDLPAAVADALMRSRDRTYGGFGSAPKFPRPLVISFLLHESLRSGRRDLRDAAIDALRAMSRGAIHDQVGGGFHRYTTDAAWRQPHWEKILTDQALRALAYTEAWQITGDETLRRVARRTLDYALRDLREKDGGFDASRDSESLAPRGGGPVIVDGEFYMWTAEDLRKTLFSSSGPVAAYFGMKPEGLNILAVAPDAVAPPELDALLARMELARSHRPQPRRDTKRIAGWNGLMLSALARAGAAFEEPAYIAAAGQTARFLESSLLDAKTKRLRRSSSGGEAFAEDYAFVIQGLLDLYEAGFNPRWLRLAIELQQVQDERFWDGDARRYRSGSRMPPLLLDVAPERDDALPSANSVAAMNLLRLSAITGSEPWRVRADAIFSALSERLRSDPASLPHLASGLGASYKPVKEIVIAGDPAREDTRALLRIAYAALPPSRVILLTSGKGEKEPLADYVPLLLAMKTTDGRATAYVCEKQICRTPTTDPARLAAFLAK